MSSRTSSVAPSTAQAASRASTAGPSSSNTASKSSTPAPGTSSKPGVSSKPSTQKSKRAKKTDVQAPPLNLPEDTDATFTAEERAEMDDDPFAAEELDEMDDDPDANSMVNLESKKPGAPPMGLEPKRRRPIEEWQSDDSLTASERKEISIQRSSYEREKQYNIVRNRRVLKAMNVQSAAKDLAKACGKLPASSTKGVKTKDVGTASSSKGVKARGVGTASGRSAEDLLGLADRGKTNAIRSKTNPFDIISTPTSPSISTSYSASALDDALGQLDEVLNIDDNTGTSSLDDWDNVHDSSIGALHTKAANDSAVETVASTPTSKHFTDEEADCDILHNESNTDTSLPGKSRSSSLPSSILTEADAPVSSLADGHPDLARWPGWMEPMVRAMERMVDNEAWSRTLSKWISFEKLMGYPSGKVSFDIFFLFLRSLTIMPSQKRLFSRLTHAPLSLETG